MPSNVDTFGTVYLEAWACGKPVIACKDCPPSSFIEDGKDGLLVKYGDKYELASSISKLLNSKEMRIKLGKNGREKVLRYYTWDIVTKRIREEYYRLAGKQDR